jgi:CHAT domain-containing protein/tetratricopeptide (TPR) repeat protein
VSLDARNGRARSAEPPATPEQLLQRAEYALDIAHSEPETARESAFAVIHDGRSQGADAAIAVAERALGQIAQLFEDLGSARMHLTRSIRYARRAGDRHGEAQARLSRAFSFAQDGRLAAAFAELDRAEVGLIDNDLDLGRLHNQRALIWWVKGQYTQAAPHFGRAIAHSERAGDNLNLTRSLVNRGVLNCQLGSYAEAVRDLERAESLADRFGLPVVAAGARQDLGWVAAQRGDVPTALHYYDQAEHDHQPHGEELGSLLLDRGNLLMGARLLNEAIAAGQRALAIFTDRGAAASTAEARLFLAEAMLLCGSSDEACAHARAAQQSFERQHRQPWVALARYAGLRSRLQRDDIDFGAARRAALQVASSLEKSGLTEQAVDVRVVAARLALNAGKITAARRELSATSAARHRGTVERRTRAWHAEALLRLASGNRSGARSALRAGLRILEEHRATLGATDLRAAASSHRVDLARLGFEMSIADGRPAEALTWVERSRAGLARLRPVRPPEDETLDRRMTELRATLYEIETAVGAGERIAALRARQSRLERAIRDHCRSLPAGALNLPPPPPSLPALARRLDQRILIEYVVHDGRLFAIVFAQGRARVHDLGSADRSERETRRLAMLLDRVARRPGDAQRSDDTTAQLAAQAQLVDHLILAPFAEDLGDATLVLAPTATLRSVPWRSLPSVSVRPVTVVPSATVWYEAAEPRAATSGASVLASGPDLPAAEPEVVLLAKHYDNAKVLTGPAATVDATMRAINGAELAHLATHGTFRADNPLFSSLRLADGPMTVYDLERLATAPRTVVLAGCETARHTPQPGDELLGLATAFLSLGTRALIASLVSLPDGESPRLMGDLHAQLSRGVPSATALAAIQSAPGDFEGHRLRASAGLICFGAD